VRAVRRKAGTHLYIPSIRRHVQRALAQGSTIEDIMEVLKLCNGLGVDACELGEPILSEELANHRRRKELNATTAGIGKK
jgi:hypothetical protein